MITQDDWLDYWNKAQPNRTAIPGFPQVPKGYYWKLTKEVMGRHWVYLLDPEGNVVTNYFCYSTKESDVFAAAKMCIAFAGADAEPRIEPGVYR